MNTAAIKLLAETQTDARLAAAEAALLQGQELPFAVPGAEAGEQLTHVLAARVVLAHMAAHGGGTAAALRAFGRRVRTAIS
jgi:hypothetical protein